MEEMEANKADLEKKPNTKKKLQEFLDKAEDDILGPTDEVGALLRSNRRNHTIVKGPDGEVHDCRPLKARKENESTNELNKVFSILNKVVDHHVGKENIEEGVEPAMLAYVKGSQKTNEDLAMECFDNQRNPDKYCSVLEAIEDVEIPTIINIYCSKGLKFEPAPFKATMERLGFTVLACNKLFMAMEKWKMEAMTYSQRNASNTNSGNSSFDTISPVTSSSGDSSMVFLSML